MRDQTPPKWAPNAIPTRYGWANPRTGEILIARRDLQNPVAGFVRNRPYTPSETVNPPEVILEVDNEEKSVESVFVEISTEPQLEADSVIDETKNEPPKKRRGRPAKKA